MKERVCVLGSANIMSEDPETRQHSVPGYQSSSVSVALRVGAVVMVVVRE